MTFIAEWGDRSQLATIVLAGMNNVWGVIVGQCLLDFSQDWRNDFWVCPFPIIRSTTPSKFSVYCCLPNRSWGQNF